MHIFKPGAAFPLFTAALAIVVASSVAACAKSSQSGEAEPPATESGELASGDPDRHDHDLAEHGDDEHGHDEHGHDDHHHRSFDDPDKYAERWNSPERDAWQRPDLVIDEMELEEGMAVADIGAGTGYFIPHLADAVGEDGAVFAVDIEEAMLAYIDEMSEELGLGHVETVKAEASVSALEEASVDRIITVNTWHHIPNRGDYAQHLNERLKDGGSVWVVDFHEDSPIGPPAEHRLDPETVADELEAGGLRAEIRELDIERQFVVVGSAD